MKAARQPRARYGRIDTYGADGAFAARDVGGSTVAQILDVSCPLLRRFGRDCATHWSKSLAGIFVTVHGPKEGKPRINANERR